MVAMSKIAIKAKIRTRLNCIERNVVKHLSAEKVKRIKEHIVKQLNLEDSESYSTGIVKPTLYTKDFFNK